MITIGERLPTVKLRQMGPSGPEVIMTQDLFGGKHVVLFALPGAFTPLCSAQHLPGYIQKSSEILAKGVDIIACLSVNDVYVMDAWGRDQNTKDKVVMLSDGSATFTTAVGLQLDLSDAGFGIRSCRYAMIVDDMVLTELKVEVGGEFQVSDAESMIKLL
ncbi:MAG: peroxiredoxin [Acidiferrobacteraceae bacterium]|nr:peroxiredoxin [Acidiferrobacteraceae bacterium]